MVDRSNFLEQVRAKRQEGLSIRAIASVLGAHRSRVHRALQSLSRKRDSLYGPPSHPPYVQHRMSESSFVGRKREIAELEAALEDALSGSGRLVMLAGEPGIGKTRTAQQLAVRAEALGVQVFWGRCYEEPGAPPYWPWVQVIRAYVQQASTEQLATEMGLGAASISEIIPEVRGKLPDLGKPPALEPEQARFRLFDSITSFLKNVAQRQPLMLLLDDLHWADRSSLLLLEFLAQEIENSPLLLLGAHRDIEVSRGHPLSQTLGALVREKNFSRVQLDGLTPQEVRELVEGNAGIILTLEAAEVVHRRTDGNPFFVGEVTRQVTPENVTQDEHWASIIPEGVRDALGRRLSRLSKHCNQMLTTASIIGRGFDFRLLSILSVGISEEKLLQAVEEAVYAHLIEDVRGQMDRYQFSHALIQQTLAEDVTTSRRVRIHARIAEALEALYGDDGEVRATELAHHYGEAEALLGTERLIHFSKIAGDRALATYAFDEALVLLSRAIAAIEGETGSTPAEQVTDEDTAAILLSLGYAQAALDQIDDALSSFHRAFDLYTSLGNVSKVVEIAGYGHSAYLISGMSDLIPRALDLVDLDSHDAGKILANYGFALGMTSGGFNSALAALERALAISKHENDELLEARTQANMANIYGLHLHWEECLNAASRAIELSMALDDFQSEMRARLWVASALIEKGDPDQASYHGEHMLELANRRRDQTWIGRALRPVLIVAVSRGDWISARGVCRQYPIWPGTPGHNVYRPDGG